MRYVASILFSAESGEMKNNGLTFAAIFFGIAFLFPVAAYSGDFRVNDFGAKGDGITPNTEASGAREAFAVASYADYPLQDVTFHNIDIRSPRGRHSER